MQAPTCKICGERHWARLCLRGVARGQIDVREASARRLPVTAPRAAPVGIKAETTGAAKKKPKKPETPKKPGFDRTANHRLYMRVWRARKRAEKAEAGDG